MIDGCTGFVLEVVALLHVALMIPIVNCSLAAFFVWLFFSRYWYVPLLYAAWWFYDQDTPYRAGRPSSIVQNLFLWPYVARYFPLKLHKTADLDPSKNYLFAYHPHSLLTFGALVNFATNATGFKETFPGIKMHLLTVNGQFRFPFYREYVIAAGLGAVDATSIDYKLTKLGPGHSVTIVIGGNAEVMAMERDKNVFKLKNRKGFIRRALKTGASIVPVISFNENRLWDVTYAEEGSWYSYFLKLIKLIFQVEAPKNAHGRPGWWAFLPKQIPVNTLVGAPIDFCEMKSFRKGQDPPEELVDECHKIYLEVFRKLYDDNKARFGDENTPLIYI